MGYHPIYHRGGLVGRVELTAMDGVVGEVQTWDLICKQVTMLEKSLPVVHGHAVSGLASVDHSKLKWPVDVGVRIGETCPLAKWGQPFGDGVGGGLGGWPNEMGVAVAIWVGDLKLGMVFQPITLVGRVVLGVCGMASIIFDKRTPILQSHRMVLDCSGQVNTDQGPFGHIRARY